jgi:hypothetical protein
MAPASVRCPLDGGRRPAKPHCLHVAESARRQGLAKAAQSATKPRTTMPKVFVVLGSP